MKSRALRNFAATVFTLLLTSQLAFGNAGTAAGQLVRSLFTNVDFVSKTTLRLSDDVAAEFTGNLTIVKQLLSAFKGSDDSARAMDFIKSIKKSVDAADKDRFAELETLLKSNGLNEGDVRKLHDLLVYFSYRYTKDNKPYVLYCILCSSGSGFAEASFAFSFKNAEGTPFNRILSDINEKSLKEVKSDIDHLMKQLDFDNFDYSGNPSLQPGQEHSFLLFLRTMKSGDESLAKYKEYALAVKELATKAAADTGKYFGDTNVNRFHMLIQEAIDLATNPQANATPEQVIETWTGIIKQLTKDYEENPAMVLADGFEEAIKRPLKDSAGNIEQKYLDEIDMILNRCKFVQK